MAVRVYETGTTRMAAPNPDAKRDYFDELAEKLEDATAYFEFLEAKLERDEGGPGESGIHPVSKRSRRVDPPSDPS